MESVVVVMFGVLVSSYMLSLFVVVPRPAVHHRAAMSVHGVCRCCYVWCLSILVDVVVICRSNAAGGVSPSNSVITVGLWSLSLLLCLVS